MTTQILVTGGAGFIGSHLCKRLVDRGDDVTCLDNLFTSRRETVAELESCSNFTFLEQDVQDSIDLDVEQIFNLACPAAPGHYQYDPVNTLKTSVIGAMRTLELAKRTNATIFHASTSEVYGDPTVHPQPESYRGNVNPIGLRACYDEGKRAAETLMFDYNRMFDVDIRVARIFNTYGPHMHPFDGRVVSNFIRQALAGEDFTIFGDGSQSRSFCYIDDMIEGILAMMSTDGAMGPVNLGNPFECTMNELAAMVLELTKSNSSMSHKPIPEDDPVQRQPDITLAKSLLGWNPSIQLEEGLQKTIEWLKRIDIDQWTPPTPNWAGGLAANSS